MTRRRPLASLASLALLVTVALALARCTSGKDAVSAPGPGTFPGQLTYLALGDSYTIGESVAPTQRFPVQLADALRDGDVNVGDPTVIARTGWRSDQLLDAIAAADLAEGYDLVTLLIGVNDQYQGRPVDGFRENLRTLLDRAESLARGGREDIIVVSIPDYSVTPFAAGGDTARIRRELETFNAVVREEALARELVYVDITPISREARGNAALSAEDGLHPSGEQYRRWVELLLAPAERALAR